MLDQAIAFYESGDRAAAKTAAASIDDHSPERGGALNLLAVIAQDEGRQAEAESHARAAIALGPFNPLYLNTLGNGLLSQGRSDEAVRVLEDAHKAAPDQADILFNLANAQKQEGMLDSAIDSYYRVLALRPGYSGAYNNLALILKATGDVESAAAILIEAVAYAPDSGELRFNLGNALHAAGRLSAAESAYRKAIQLVPDHADAYANLGVVLAEGGLKLDAEKCFRKALEINPELAPAYVGLADLVDDGSLDAVAHRRTVLALKPDLAAIRSSLLMCMHYSPEATREALFEEHKTFGAMHAGNRAQAYHTDHDYSADRKLRIGIVSGDFRFHAMLFFVLPVLEARDSASWEVFCYSTTARTDEHTKAFRAAADKWRDVRSLAAIDLAHLIVGDGIDILIDLSGHAPNNRLLAFAAKAAPLQVAWGDYVDTRGLEAIDIFLGDAMHSPPGDDQYYVERVVRFAPDYICYRPPNYAPPVSSPPCLTNGCLTFGSFSEVTKIGPTAVAQWAFLLRAVPDARFLLNGHLLSDGAHQGRIISMFMDEGIGTDRVIFQTGGPHEEFLAQYSEVDIVLDTAPYSGGLTTCEALLMGVPVLTVPGNRFSGRHAATHLTNGGYPEGVAESMDDLVNKAQALSADHNSLAELRKNTRQRFLDSRLCDVPAFSADFYNALHAEWTDLCATKSAKS
jgi:protein O-GlcNAc transferase